MHSTHGFNKSSRRKQETDAKTEELLTSFISKYYSVGPGLKTGTEDFRHAYNKFADSHALNSYTLVPKMKAKGFTKKVVSINGILMQGFVGLSLRI